MTLEGSRKFIAMLLGLAGTWILAKYGAQWGGIWNTAVVIAAPMVGSVLYMLINYLQKTTSDTFVPENWLSGKRTFIGLILAILAPILSTATIDMKDAVTQVITLIADIGVPTLFMIFQGLSDKKMAAVAPPVIPSNPLAFTPIPAPINSTTPVVTKPTIIYQYADVEAVATEIIKKFPNNPLEVAYRFYESMNLWDLRQVQPKERVKQAKEFVYKAKQLFYEGFKWYTKLEPPSDADLANKAMVSYKIKKDYEKANGLTCSGKVFTEINSLLGSMDDFLGYDQAFAMLGEESENLDWGTFSGRGYSPAEVPQYAGALVKESIITKK